jgi:hypothetical protein
MRESNYWLRVINAILTDIKSIEQINFLITESDELKKILGSIVTKTNKKIIYFEFFTFIFYLFTWGLQD